LGALGPIANCFSIQPIEAARWGGIGALLLGRF